MNNTMGPRSASRRMFIGKAAVGLTAFTVSPGLSFPARQENPRKIRIGIIGGRFGTSFQFHEHPDCIVEAVSDLRKNTFCPGTFINDPEIMKVFIESNFITVGILII